MYKQIISANGWYFRHEDPQGKNNFVIWTLAAWALKDDGTVIGLVSAPFGDMDTSRLSSVPPGKGQYLQENQLTDDEKIAVKKR